MLSASVLRPMQHIDVVTGSFTSTAAVAAGYGLVLSEFGREVLVVYGVVSGRKLRGKMLERSVGPAFIV